MPASLPLARLRRESSGAAFIPCSSHADPWVLRTQQGDYLQVFRLGGTSFESADDEVVNNWHERLNVLWRNLASPHIALWSHVVRRRDHTYPDNRYPPGFAADLNDKYRRKIAGSDLMVNELYLSLLYRPQPTRAGAAALGLMRKRDAQSAAAEVADALDQCTKRRLELLTALARYDPEPLGTYRDEHGRDRSSALEFLAWLINGEWQPIPLPRAAAHDVLLTSRPLFGHEVLEYRTLQHNRLGAILGIKEYCTPTVPGVFDALLTAPFPFVLTHSFTFIPKATATQLMSRQYRRMRASEDLGHSQVQELHQALDDLTSNRFCLGDHHFTFQVLGDPYPGHEPERHPQALQQLNDRVAAARFLLGEAGIVVAREDLALEAAFWAQLPGNFAFRPRKAPVTSRNFAAMVPFHNHPTGRLTGNWWGNALALFVTSVGSPLYFSLHASDPRAPDGGSQRDVGHLVGIGPTGGGKTTVIGTLIALLTAFDATQVVFDHHEGLHILVRALGGRYLPLHNGQPTGCNPLQLPATPTNREFLKQWLRRLVRRTADEVLTVAQQEDLDQALHGTLCLEPPARRLSRLLEFLDATDPEGLHARLRPWCTAAGGDYAWVFDNPVDQVDGLLDGSPIVGFDLTDFLDHPTVRDPMSMYLFHLVHRMVDGRRLVVWADEFARLLSDPSFTRFAADGLENWRKMNAAFAGFTQNASHVIASPIARTILEQTPTKLFFPNPEADVEDYTGHFNLTDREYRLVRQELEPGSRCFLVKQHHTSAVARLDLQGFDAELAVISGRTANVRLMRELIARHGPEPHQWLPAFMAAVQQTREGIRPAPTAQEVQHA